MTIARNDIWSDSLAADNRPGKPWTDSLGGVKSRNRRPASLRVRGDHRFQGRRPRYDHEATSTMLPAVTDRRIAFAPALLRSAADHHSAATPKAMIA